MNETEIFNKVAELLAEHFDIEADKVTNELNFKKDLDGDSINFLEFVMDLEDTFGAEISDEDAAKLETVGQAVEYIKSHQ
ncbi:MULTISPECIES: acyl carrier protein [Lactobacillus]|jgi:acyl carrier protein|uniref:Acyl carrier protein n=1 Tax=Lactobacillus mulieris TaxID=2508708 RepID=A0AAP3GNN0_9LACO|nr:MULTISPECIES: acyl carrier protein [Lactobacillus]EEU21557.1 acyl carrier protein [Lactobacillus jensenii 27-2-CHN]EEX24428.1 acyl carrier protein [Lactobacillus jensenii 115-3-CHN]EFH29601.1 acyl carrier protein [Lactobacillus jensenii JV-V16]KAA9244901.1 acyl carrier protein [Lactobacillus jensenii]KAA9367555.1 acyl carrier protein [Lactobacillus jensenii]